MSPEFRFGESALGQIQQGRDSPRKTLSKPQESLLSDCAQGNKTVEEKEAEGSQLKMLREELRRKNEEIRRLLTHKESPEMPSSVLFSPYRQNVKPRRTENMRKVEFQEPFAKAKSVTPLRTSVRQDVSMLTNVSPKLDQSVLIETSSHPVFKQQQFFTTKQPKVHLDNPITDKDHAGIGRLQLQDYEQERRRGLADYGNLLLSPFNKRL